jgi:hypothetical protein
VMLRAHCFFLSVFVCVKTSGFIDVGAALLVTGREREKEETEGNG